MVHLLIRCNGSPDSLLFSFLTAEIVERIPGIYHKIESEIAPFLFGYERVRKGAGEDGRCKTNAMS
jgi:hypothetical protein